MGLTYTILIAALAAFVSFGFGALWHGPIFGRQWMKYMKLKKTHKPATWRFIGTYLQLFFAALVLSGIMLEATTLMSALLVTVFLWFGFTAIPALSPVFWENKPIHMYGIVILYDLASYVLMTCVIVLF